MTDIASFGFPDDVEFARYLVKDVGVAAVPGSSFYRNRARGRTKLRFCFCKRTRRCTRPIGGWPSSSGRRPLTSPWRFLPSLGADDARSTSPSA